MSTKVLKERVQEYLDEIADRLIAISHDIHANPELSFEEYRTMALLADTAAAHGFEVDRGIAGLPTAFVATSQGEQPGPTIAFIAEYDALPELGHACGHNIIGTAATGAALALQAIRAELPGTIKLIGTPAEERGGGKVIMVEHGVFDEIDAAMMVHPGSKTMTTRGTLASNKVDFEFFGQSSHAAAAPDMGINALDACILTFNNINALRQHLTDDVRIHGIITDGGKAANIVPDYASASFSVRAATSEKSFEVLKKVIRCAEAAAIATGATVKAHHRTHYANRIANPTMAQLFGENVTQLGEAVVEPEPNERMGSSDMGNVSQHVPAIHPYLPIADVGTSAHTSAFAEAAVSARGDRALMRAAKAMAMTAVDLITQPALMDAVRRDFAATVDLNAAWRKQRFHS